MADRTAANRGPKYGPPRTYLLPTAPPVWSDYDPAKPGSRHEQMKPYKCPLCYARLPTEVRLRKHWKREHPQETAGW